MDRDVELNFLNIKDDGILDLDEARSIRTPSSSGKRRKGSRGGKGRKGRKGSNDGNGGNGGNGGNSNNGDGNSNSPGFYFDDPEQGAGASRFGSVGFSDHGGRLSFGMGRLGDLTDVDGLGGMGGVRRKNPLVRWADSFRRDPARRFTTDIQRNHDHYGSSSLGPGSDRHPSSAGYSLQPSMRERDGGGGSFSAGGLGAPDGPGGPGGPGGHGAHFYDMHGANVATANSGLARVLKGRHLQMIAIGGSIGTGLFVASGRTLSQGGPAALLLAYTFIGCMLYCTMHALGELAVAFPIAGSFSAFSTRFLDPSWGFAMGWNYAMQWLIVMPLEVIAASMTVNYWNPGLNKAIFVSLFFVAIVTINLFGVKAYGEAEFVFSIVKVIAIIGFILLGIVINIGGTPSEGYIGGKFWRTPGAFNNGFKGTCSVLVTAAFAFAGTELVGLAAAEARNPRKTLPTAIKQVFWRITLFYIVALTLVGLLVPYNNPRLLGAKNMADAAASPFVIAIESAGIQVLPSIMNAVILVAVVSVGNSAIFGSSRTLAALADQGQAPQILSYIDRRGRPLMAIAVSSLVGLLAFLADLKRENDVLEWLSALSGLSSVFTWGSICLSHIRFRKAWARRGRPLSALAFRAHSGTLGSWVGLVLNVLILIAQFWVGLWPVDYGKNTWRSNVQNLFLQYLAVPIVVIMMVAHKVWYRTTYVRLEDMDLDTGRREFDLTVVEERERDERIYWPRWKKLYKFFC